MCWKIEIKGTCKKALAKIDKDSQEEILNYLYKKVTKKSHPKQLGKALRHGYKGLWRYRVGKFRIICEIQKS